MLPLNKIRALSTDEILVKIMEEAGEVTQAAAKCYWWGPKSRSDKPEYQNTPINAKWLQEEMRQLVVYVDEYLSRIPDIDSNTGE